MSVVATIVVLNIMFRCCFFVGLRADDRVYVFITSSTLTNFLSVSTIVSVSIFE
jgi:hypothetical protein